jgi:hypothetical protein
MVDRIASAARRATLEAEELGVQPRHVEEVDAPAFRSGRRSR